MPGIEKLDKFVTLFNNIPDSPQKEVAKFVLGSFINDIVLETNCVTPTTVNVEVEKNTKGFNYKAVVVGAESVEQALEMLGDAQNGLAYHYGGDELGAFKKKLKDKTLSLAQEVSDDFTLSPDAKYQASVLLLAIDEFIGGAQ